MTSKPITWPFLIRDNLEKDKRAAKPVQRDCCKSSFSDKVGIFFRELEIAYQGSRIVKYFTDEAITAEVEGTNQGNQEWKGPPRKFSIKWQEDRANGDLSGRKTCHGFQNWSSSRVNEMQLRDCSDIDLRWRVAMRKNIFGTIHPPFRGC